SVTPSTGSWTAPNWAIGSLANGASATLTVVAKVKATGVYANTVTVSGNETDPTPGNNTDTSTPNAVPLADISILKTDNKANYTAGQTVTYSITVKNNGPSEAADVKVTDDLPTGISAALMTWSGNGATATGAMNNIIKSLANGASVIYTVVINVPSNYSGNLVNTATAVSTTKDPELTNNTSTDTNTAEPLANLVTTKTLKVASQTNYIPGDEVVYLIKVVNNGPSDALNVSIVDNAPVGTTISKWTATATGFQPVKTSGTGNLNETIAVIPNGAVLTYEVTVKTPANHTSTFRNLVSVTSPTPDNIPNVIINPDPSCPSCVVSPFVEPIFRVDLSMIKRSEIHPIGLGYQFKYTLEVKNNSEFDATGVIASDVLPSGISYVSHQTSNGTANYTSTSRALDWNIGVLKSGATATLTLTVTADRIGWIINSATVKGNETDPNTSNNSSTDNKEVLNFKIPNVITPNGDGKNDTFRIEGLELYPENNIIIFNRWGNEVYHSNGSYQHNWSGEGLNAGTYYYLLKVKDPKGNWNAHKGYITLLNNN
ncbi:MAG: DUF11 domain-containing protein, partial [Pedobacter sp.]